MDALEQQLQDTFVAWVSERLPHRTAPERMVRKRVGEPRGRRPALPTAPGVRDVAGR